MKVLLTFLNNIVLFCGRLNLICNEPYAIMQRRITTQSMPRRRPHSYDWREVGVRLVTFKGCPAGDGTLMRARAGHATAMMFGQTGRCDRHLTFLHVRLLYANLCLRNPL
jgi:hypothetical protein